VSKVSRRQMLGGAIVAGSSFPFVNIGMYRLDAQAKQAYPDRTYSKRAIDLVRQSLIIDMLAPVKIAFGPDFYAKPMSAQDTADFRASGITGFHHAVGIGGPDARESALTFMAIWGNYIARNSHVLTGVDKVADMIRAKKEGKAAVIIGLQNADQFRRPDDVKFFYDIGLRCSQLTYNSQNRIGSGSTDRVDGGVSDFGASIIKAMNDVGMLVDTSHCGDKTTLDAIDISTKPIAITHSNCRALVDHPRVKTDAAIKALAAKGGVMGITGVRMFVSKTEPTAIGAMVDHIDHVVKLVGIDHVGIGTDSDLNGYDDMPDADNKALRAGYKESYAFREKIDTDGFDHPRKMYDLTEELIRRKYSDANISAILGGNFQRLLTSTWGG
jgi:membrane dipeptidase